MKRLFAAIGLGLILFPSLAFADNSSSADPGQAGGGGTAPADICVQEIHRNMHREQFLYETVLFGLRPSADEPAGAMRLDEDGTLWIKNSDQQWTTDDQDPIGDDAMDSRTLQDPLAGGTSSQNSTATHLGIFETQRASTSDLIPPLLQSMRAFKCRLAAVCESVNISLKTPKNGESTVDEVAVPGCEPLPFTPYPGCQLSQSSDAGATATAFDADTLLSYCRPVAAKFVAYEEAQMRFLAHYDGAHRSLRQLGGFLEPLLEAVKFPLLNPLRQAVTFLSQWANVPCFLSYCADTNANP